MSNVRIDAHYVIFLRNEKIQNVAICTNREARTTTKYRAREASKVFFLGTLQSYKG